MATIAALGQADHGRPMTAEEFEKGDYEPGFKYELIEGRLYVSPVPIAPQNCVLVWLLAKLTIYAMQHPEVINHVTPAARVFLPDQPDQTRPEPDLAAYAGWPQHLPFEDIHWRDVSPVLVVEILSADDPDKDLSRNVRLYREVPSISEYWIIDPRRNATWPTLIVRRRGKRGWQRAIRVRAGGTYTTPLLHGFTLVMDGHT
jgi:Uma2 family endonuclease